jgi:hypothetical protein
MKISMEVAFTWTVVVGCGLLVAMLGLSVVSLVHGEIKNWNCPACVDKCEVKP